MPDAAPLVARMEAMADRLRAGKPVHPGEIAALLMEMVGRLEAMGARNRGLLQGLIAVEYMLKAGDPVSAVLGFIDNERGTNRLIAEKADA